MKVHILTLGCKVNIYESEIMREKLEDAGYFYAELDDADIIIINTCSVTNMADKKSQKLVRQTKKKRPEAILVVAGCSSENKKDLYETLNIDILLGNKDKSQIVSLLDEFLKDKKRIVRFYHTRRLPFEDMSVNRFKSHTRAFLKIQDGCNNFCSYCIIPYVRGDIRSKEMKKALEEVNVLVNNGHREIVLTGIHTGSYGYEFDYDLTDLIREMSKLKNLDRIRISSIEITELNDKFLNELKNNSKICNHLHIPLQAGSDEILQKMNRKYNLNYFENKLNKIREIRPDISITTDVIVGHPYETNELFLKTLETIQKFKFSKVHAFPYSVREGTKAAIMPEQVIVEEKKERNRKLVSLSNMLEQDYANSFLNQEMEVLIEEIFPTYAIGHTSNYLKVKLMGENYQSGQVYVVEIKEILENELLGEKVK